MHLSERYTKEHPVDPQWVEGGGTKKTKRRQKSKRKVSKSKGEEAAAISFFTVKSGKSKEKDTAEEAAKLLSKIADMALMGQKKLKSWVACCNANKDADETERKQWGGETTTGISLDTKLFQKALKRISKGRCTIEPNLQTQNA